MYESVKRKGRAVLVLLHILVHEKSLPIFSTNEKHGALLFTFFQKSMTKKRNF